MAKVFEKNLAEVSINAILNALEKMAGQSFSVAELNNANDIATRICSEQIHVYRMFKSREESSHFLKVNEETFNLLKQIISKNLGLAKTFDFKAYNKMNEEEKYHFELKWIHFGIFYYITFVLENSEYLKACAKENKDMIISYYFGCGLMGEIEKHEYPQIVEARRFRVVTDQLVRDAAKEIRKEVADKAQANKLVKQIRNSGCSFDKETNYLSFDGDVRSIYEKYANHLLEAVEIDLRDFFVYMNICKKIA